MGSAVQLSGAERLVAALRREIARVLVLDDALVEILAVALLARGHVLIEGVPGTGKTLLARTLARLLALSFRRIQFTNDLMPSDIVGATVWRARRESFEFLPGPLFTNIVLADEINRTSPRTLSCLLEAMEAGEVSVDGRTHALPQPFFVLATRNPIEFHGTYPLPEAALDRFLVRVRIDYPPPEGELGLYRGRDPETALEELEPLLDPEALAALGAAACDVRLSEPVAAYALETITATRTDERIALGASPRAGLMWLRAARARALLRGRAHVLPDDLQALAGPVLGHRVLLRDGADGAAQIEALLASIPVRL